MTLASPRHERRFGFDLDPDLPSIARRERRERTLERELVLGAQGIWSL